VGGTEQVFAFCKRLVGEKEGLGTTRNQRPLQVVDSRLPKLPYLPQFPACTATYCTTGASKTGFVCKCAKGSANVTNDAQEPTHAIPQTSFEDQNHDPVCSLVVALLTELALYA
jgi:hypothetical protein